MNGSKYTVQARMRKDAPPEEAEYRLAAARRKAGNELYGILLANKMPAVVDIKETVSEEHGQGWVTNERDVVLRIEMTVNPVRHHHVTMAAVDSEMYRYKTVSLWTKIKRFLGL